MDFDFFTCGNFFSEFRSFYNRRFCEFGKVYSHKSYTHTKAICDGNNFCQDYKITCENDSVEKMEPITGATVQHSEEWDDPREKPEKIC